MYKIIVGLESSEKIDDYFRLLDEYEDDLVESDGPEGFDRYDTYEFDNVFSAREFISRATVFGLLDSLRIYRIMKLLPNEV